MRLQALDAKLLYHWPWTVPFMMYTLNYRPKPKKLMLVGTPGTKTSTPASQELKDNHIQSSPCVTPIVKSELPSNTTKREAVNRSLPNDVVVLDDEDRINVFR